jgi:glutamate 5-kinase
VSTTSSPLASAALVVVKVGSSSLTHPGGALDVARLDRLVDALARRRHEGVQVVLVSSGAIAAGITPLGLAKRPRDLATQQAAASVGQGALVAAYSSAFGRYDLTVGQVLLTADDVTRRQHYANARRALERLLSLGIVPVVNENDTVATQEIRFGDNDRLAALVAHLVRADALLLLSDVDALYDRPPSKPGATRIPLVRHESELADLRIAGSGTKVGSGGMVTKVDAAGIATAAGIPTVLTSADQAAAALAGEDVGTRFAPTGSRRPYRLLWLAHASTSRGRLVLDDGAVAAVAQRHKSLLPAGVVAVEGTFREGDPIDLCALDGSVVARGLVSYDSEVLPRLLGRSTHDLARDLGSGYEREVVHRDHLVLL